MAMTISPASASLAHSSGTQQFTVTDNINYQWTIYGVDLTGSSITAGGLFSAGPNTGTCVVRAKRYDGEYAQVTVTVT